MRTEFRVVTPRSNAGAQIALVFDENNDLIERDLHGPAIDQILATEIIDPVTADTEDVLWSLTDHLGTVRDVVDNNGDVVNHMVYDSYGNITSQTGSAEVRFTVTGQITVALLAELSP